MSENYINITPCTTSDTSIDLEITVSCHEYSTVYELLSKVVDAMSENNTAIEPGKYRVKLIANIASTFL